MISYTLDRVRTQILDAVRRAVGDGADLAAAVPPPEVPADLAVPCFPLASTLRKSPAAIAEELSRAIPTDGAVAAVRADGGYLNVVLDRGTFAVWVTDDIARMGDQYGRSDLGTGQTVVIDYSSPNIAKPMGVHHLRSTIIGDALRRIMAFNAYGVIGDNHLGDWGTSFGGLLYAFDQWVDRSAYEREPIGELLRLYVRFNEEARQRPELADRARSWSLRLERGDPQARAWWEEFVRHSRAEFDRVYDLLGVQFEYTLGESFYEDKTGVVIQEAVRTGIAAEHEGALIVPLEDVGIQSPLLLRRSDGATLYETRDLAAAVYRIKTFHPSQILYVVGADQRLYLSQVFATIRKLGYADVKLVHIDFGLITLPGGKLSTRRGRMVLLEDILHEAISRAHRLVDEKNPELSADERMEVARMVGIGAVKYADLSQNRVKNIAFDWDRMLALDGDSAPYLQYTYVRARGILRKAPDVAAGGAYDRRAAETPQEWALLKTLARFPEVVREAAQTYHPHLVCNYLFQLAQQFHAFYHDVPVLQAADPALRDGRIQLVFSVATVMRTGLGLLGIEVPERM